MAAIKPRHGAVADDAHQTIGRQQYPDFGQVQAKVAGIHRQQQLQQHIGRQGHAQREGGEAGVAVGGA
ncbi:hypothetical protein GCM10017655_19620 [Pseudomonas turukhanskensis]|uniref:Uncharacterized protein n=1 Tax=Pseudomonas turukhanskensis TaxID=1806536 RepID=A0A9W6NFK2_9PSED|nr:hypothetical protein GCM10017655_19620 [Pseudomonas turukhanskensis]